MLVPPTTVTKPPKLFAELFRLIVCAPASSAVVPLTTIAEAPLIAPLIAPPACTTSLPLRLTVPSASPLLSRSCASYAVTETAPVKSLPALSSTTLCPLLVMPVMVKLLLPATLMAPLSLIVPPAVRARLPVTLEVLRSSATVSTKVTSFAPLILTLPAKLLAWLSVMS